MTRPVSYRTISVVTMLVLVLGVIHFVNFQRSRDDLHLFVTARRAALAFADGLRQTSDDLTRMVRLYAITGESSYRSYFDEILAIRNGDLPRPIKYFEVPYWDIVLDTGEQSGEFGDAKPIRTLAREAGLTESELAWFEMSENASNDLVLLENEVMVVIAAQIEASGIEYELEGESLGGMLRLHGHEYHAAKTQVMRPLVELDGEVSSELSAGRREAIDLNNKSMQTAFVLLGLTLLLMIAGIWTRRRLRILMLLALLAVLVSTFLAISYRRERPNLSAFLSARLNALHFADGLRQTSDDLTRMVRLYAVNGDPVYRTYFNEILDIRNGDAPRPEKYFDVPYWDIVLDTGVHTGDAGNAAPIRILAGEAGLTAAELAGFEKAEDASNVLAELENEIMEIVAAQIEASGGDYVLGGEALAAMLRLHGPEYHAAKARVMEPLVELDRRVDIATAEWRGNVQAFYDRVMFIIIALLGLSFLFLAGDMWLQRRQDQHL